jgi:hypothetical protein
MGIKCEWKNPVCSCGGGELYSMRSVTSWLFSAGVSWLSTIPGTSSLTTGVQKSLESVLIPERSGNDKLLDLVSGEEGAYRLDKKRNEVRVVDLPS